MDEPDCVVNHLARLVIVEVSKEGERARNGPVDQQAVVGDEQFAAILVDSVANEWEVDGELEPMQYDVGLWIARVEIETGI